MTFVAFVVRNLVRQRTRSLLTIVGIGIGITTVVALGAITSGFRVAAAEMAHLGGADLMVAQKGAADLTFSTLRESDLELVRDTTGVASAAGVLLHVDRVGSNPFFVVYGVERSEIPLVAPPLAAGAYPGSDTEIVVGDRAGDDLGGIGGTATIGGRPFRVVGVYGGASLYERSGGYVSLASVQEITGKDDVLSAIYVTAEDGVDVPALASTLEGASDRFAAIRTADDYGEVDQGLEILDAANLAISLLAVLIGTIGVMNTMVMAVFERTREIGILRAVGWRGSRIVRMIVGESLALCLVAAALGIAAGVAATRALVFLPAVGSFLEPTYGLGLFLRALAVAVGVSLAGALYPAIRAVRLSPMEALRHE